MGGRYSRVWNECGVEWEGRNEHEQVGGGGGGGGATWYLLIGVETLVALELAQPTCAVFQLVAWLVGLGWIDQVGSGQIGY